MQIELYVDRKTGEKKIYSTATVPMLARRKYFEIQAKAEGREGKPTTADLLKEDDEILSIITDVVFENQFSINQLLYGASKPYIDEKLAEAVWGVKSKKEDNEEGNKKGK